jgi:thioredoxin-related protein
MKYFLLFALMVFLASCSMKTDESATADSEHALAVHFQKTAFSDATARAKHENKLMLMDVYATWCVPCKKLDKAVFSDQEIGDFINTKFVSLKVDGEKGEGPELMKKFGVPGYPTIILLDQNGEEIDRLVGFDGKKDNYFQTLKDYLEGKNTLKDYLSRIENESDNIELNYDIATKFLYREEPDKALKYYQRVVEFDPSNAKGHKDEAQYQIASTKMEINDDPQSLQEFIKNSTDEGYVKRAYSSLTRYYRKHENIEKLIATHEDCITRFPKSASMMNAYAWDIFRMKASEYYARGIEVAKKALELEPDAAAIWDTLGQLEFEAGNVAEAIEAMQKAADLEPDTESFKDNLERYKKSQMKA